MVLDIFSAEDYFSHPQFTSVTLMTVKHTRYVRCKKIYPSHYPTLPFFSFYIKRINEKKQNLKQSW